MSLKREKENKNWLYNKSVTKTKKRNELTGQYLQNPLSFKNERSLKKEIPFVYQIKKKTEKDTINNNKIQVRDGPDWI